MIIVSVTFVICWFPSTFYWVVVDNTEQTSTALYTGYYATLFLSYLYICMNPFIYAIKHEGVKQKLASLNICRKAASVDVHPSTADGREGSNVVAGGTRSTHTGTALQ